MDGQINFILILSCFLSLVMGGVSLSFNEDIKSKNFNPLVEFWLSMALNFVFVLIFWSFEGLRVLSLLGWIWPMKTISRILGNFTENQILGNIHFLVIAAGGFMTLTMVGYGFSFRESALPCAITTNGLGLYGVFKSFKLSLKNGELKFLRPPILLFGIFFVFKMSYPFWGENVSLFIYAAGLEFFFLACLAGTVPLTYLKLLKNSQENLTQKVLKQRSEKFIGQSKFSELGMLSAGIAHEINNPLAVIMARTSQLLRVYQLPEKNAQVGEGLVQIYNTSERINKTIQGIREFVHENDNGPLRDVNLKELFESVLSFCGQRMKNHGISLRLYGITDVSVKGHKVQLEQVILNLFNNSFDAIEFLPDKWIEVSCHQRNGKIQLYFKDSGHGIAPEIASRMMEPFFSTKEVGKGTGLGLSLSQGIAQKHSGSLTYLKDRPFTTFLLELPVTLQ